LRAWAIDSRILLPLAVLDDFDPHAAACPQPVPGSRPGPTRTRKIKEAITALKIEAVHSKEKILETCPNTVPFDLKDPQARDYPARMCRSERLTTRFRASYAVEHALRCTPFSQEPYGKP
jgi:hypothetical protein